MSDKFPSLADLVADAKNVIYPRFDEKLALDLGHRLTQIALAEGLGVVINIRTANRTLFHAATPKSAALNDLWARRKSNTALMTGKASLMVGVENRARGRSLLDDGLNMTEYAENGGAVPVAVTAAGVVAVVTVSGLPQVEDHALVMRAMRAQVSEL
jgi:uncharacterized protein (UPF0303 family)